MACFILERDIHVIELGGSRSKTQLARVRVSRPGRASQLLFTIIFYNALLLECIYKSKRRYNITGCS